MITRVKNIPPYQGTTLKDFENLLLEHDIKGVVEENFESFSLNISIDPSICYSDFKDLVLHTRQILSAGWIINLKMEPGCSPKLEELKKRGSDGQEGIFQKGSP